MHQNEIIIKRICKLIITILNQNIPQENINEQIIYKNEKEINYGGGDNNNEEYIKNNEEEYNKNNEEEYIEDIQNNQLYKIDNKNNYNEELLYQEASLEKENK